MSKTIDLKRNIDTGFNEFKQKSTWRRVGAVACGSLLGSAAVILTNKLTSRSSKVFQYGTGTLGAGAVAIASLGVEKEFTDYMGFGAAMVCAGQAVNTASTLLTNKTIAEWVNK